MVDKAVNYTAEQTDALVKAYKEAEGQEGRQAVVEQFAENFGKSVASIRAKLVAEGVYVKAERARKRVARKSELVTALAETLGLDEDVIGSLEKATSTALVKVIGAVGRIKYEAEQAE